MISPERYAALGEELEACPACGYRCPGSYHYCPACGAALIGGSALGGGRALLGGSGRPPGRWAARPSVAGLVGALLLGLALGVVLTRALAA